MKLTIKSIVLAASLALPTFFAGSAFALNAPSTCGGSCTAASSNIHGYSAGMTVNCYSCHSMPVVVTPPPVVTPPKPPVVVPPVVTPPVTGTVTPHATSKSCGACVKGTAPSSVSAHKNVNSTMTACSACHGGGSTSGTGGSTGGTTGGTTSGHSDDHHSTTVTHSDDSHGATSGSTSSNSHTGKHRHND